ncbi:MAG TPA: asparagine synthase-related protein [Steroidobacteraceae bacterium]|jgi:asparagine synthase (glutamine-hydrolysing)|nr:asparagine synthase-related protein [Steroidobacteraceae bacterium]
MALFGLLGRLPDTAFADFMAYGARLHPGLESQSAASNDGLHSASWAPAVAHHEGRLAIALSGQPALSPSLMREAHAGAAAAILAGYREAGPRVLESLSGRFALAITDAAEERALLAVDRMGIERVTYAMCDGCLIFGSSAEAVANSPMLRAPLDPQALFDYLLLHMVPAPNTVFRGVAKLRPGTCAILEKGALRIERYWNPQFQRNGRAESFESLKEGLHAALRTGVKSAAPNGTSGAFLSGGLDSSSVAGVLSEVAPPARTFSIGFSYPQYDERSYARIANARFKCEGHEYVIQGTDIAETFPRIARAYDEPFGNSSALPVYYCARLAREHGVDHLLAGDGGDELFAGNSRYAEHQVFERYRLVPGFLRKGLLEPALQYWPRALMNPLVRKARGYVSKANTPLPSRLEAYNIMNQDGGAEFLDPSFRAAIDPAAPFRDMHEVWDAANADNTIQRMLFYDWQYTLSDNDLRKVESMTALAGVRVSYPMLHADVIDLSLRVPPDIMMPGMRLRDFYKRATAGWLPDEIINKKKHGFGLPFGLWLQDSPQLRELITANLSSLRGRRLIRPEFIDRLLALHGNEDASFYGVFVWVLAMLEQWLQEHDRGDFRMA